MRKIFLLVLIFSVYSVFGTTHTISIGGDYTDIPTAASAASAYDTLLLDGGDGVDTSYIYSGQTDLKEGQVLMSKPGRMNEILKDDISTGGTIVRNIGPNTRIENVKMRFVSGVANGYSYMTDFDYSCHMKNVIFWSDSTERSSYLRGVRFDNNGVDTATMDGCIVHQLYTGVYGGTVAAAMGKKVAIRNCLLTGAKQYFGTNWTTENTIMTYGGSNLVIDESDSTTFYRVWFDHENANTELVSWDENNYKSSGNKIYYCVFVNSGHQYLMWDYWWYSQCNNNVFISEQTNTNNVYNHFGENLGGADTVGYRCQFYNNTFYGFDNTNRAYVMASGDPLDSVLDCSFRRELILGDGPVDGADNMARDTVDSMVSEKEITVHANYTISDTVYNVGKAFLIDTGYFCFHKRSSPYHWAGAKGYWFTPFDTSSITDSTITWACILSDEYRHNNEIYDSSLVENADGDTVLAFQIYNSWFSGDTATYYIDTSTDKSTWGSAGSSEIVAGDTVDLTTDNLSASTLYYIRQRVENTDFGLYDTSAIDSFTTTGAPTPTDTAVIYNISPAVGNIDGGDTVDVVGLKLGSATFEIDGSECTIIFQCDKTARVISPSGSDGAQEFIALISGGVPDTSEFTYYTATTFDTLFVDSAIASYTTEYDIATRSATGGSYTACPTVQQGVDSMAAGSAHILLRDGTYTEVVNLPWTKNGSAWVDGHFNIIESYQDEWAKIDGNNDSGFVIGILSDNIITRATTYWKFRKLEVTGGAKTTDSSRASGFHMNKGPIVIDSCVIHDNIANGESGDILGGIVGYGWDMCIIQNCVFYNNGDTLENNDNFADISLYSDYRYNNIDTGFIYWPTVKSRVRNKIRYNYFKKGDYQCGGIFGKGGQILCGQNLDGDSFSYDYKNFGDDIHHNIFENRRSAIRWPTTYAQIHNNVFDSCILGYMSNNPDAYMIQGVVAYNNTGTNCIHSVIRLCNSDYADGYTTNFERNLFGWIENNLSDTSASVPVYNEEEFSSLRTPGDATANYDSTYVRNNYSWNPDSNPTYDPSGTYFYMERENRYTVSSYSKWRNWLNYRDAGNLLWDTLYIADSSHIIATGTPDTTMANGGIGGDHPYIEGITLPSYVGAAITGDAWPDTVLALSELGVTPTYTITVIDSPAAGGSSTVLSGGTVDSNGVDTVVAVPAANYHLVRWGSSDGSSTTNGDTIFHAGISENIVDTAFYGLDTFYLSNTPADNGVITYLTDSIAEYGGTIRVYFTVESGYVGSWDYGTFITGVDSQDVVMYKDSAITAETHAIPTVTIDTTWGDSIASWEITEGLSVDSGSAVHTVVTVTAGSRFVGYTGDFESTTANTVFYPTANWSITATGEDAPPSSATTQSRWIGWRPAWR